MKYKDGDVVSVALSSHLWAVMFPTWKADELDGLKKRVKGRKGEIKEARKRPERKFNQYLVDFGLDPSGEHWDTWWFHEDMIHSPCIFNGG